MAQIVSKLRAGDHPQETSIMKELLLKTTHLNLY